MPTGLPQSLEIREIVECPGMKEVSRNPENVREHSKQK